MFEKCSGISNAERFRDFILPRDRLSKEAREMIDTGKLKTVCREETDERTTTSVDREKRRIARQKERRATLILGPEHNFRIQSEGRC